MNYKFPLLITGLLLMGILVSAKTHTVPQKICGHPAPPAQSTHPRRTPLDDIFNSTDVPRHIPDGPGGVATSTLTIDSSFTINDLNVEVSITHTWVRDLRVSLISPSETEIVLIDTLYQDDAVNMTNTWFDDEAALPMDSGVPPFTGLFRPRELLAAFDSMNTAGTWTLRVEDQFALDTGSIQAWAIEINPIVNLEGQVTDSLTQQGLPNANVTLFPVDTAATDTPRTRTNNDGHYEFVHISPGTYVAQFAKANYATLIDSAVEVTSNSTTELNVVMHTISGTYDFASTSAPVPVPDTSSASMSLQINTDLTISDLDVTINITHSFVSDLSVFLIGPASDTVLLKTSAFNVAGANLTETRFDDQATTPIGLGIAPFTGSFRPEQPLNLTFANHGTLGTWTLFAVDSFAQDQGQIDNFTLHITPVLAADDPHSLHPSSFTLSSYPNPFNATTELRFELAAPAQVELTVFDLLGRRVASLLNAPQTAGVHQLSFDASSLPSGLYIARLTTPTQSLSRKIVLLK